MNDVMCDDICMDMCYEYFSRYRKQRLTLGDDGFITMSPIWFESIYLSFAHGM